MLRAVRLPASRPQGQLITLIGLAIARAARLKKLLRAMTLPLLMDSPERRAATVRDLQSR